MSLDIDMLLNQNPSWLMASLMDEPSAERRNEGLWSVCIPLVHTIVSFSEVTHPRIREYYFVKFDERFRYKLMFSMPRREPFEGMRRMRKVIRRAGAERLDYGVLFDGEPFLKSVSGEVSLIDLEMYPDQFRSLLKNIASWMLDETDATDPPL